MPTDAIMPDLADSPPSGTNPQQPKRIRVILSCGPCRASKLKCDRQDPCSQCHKKGRPQDCRYVPRPARPQKAAKSMAARLRRLEGMVRGLLDEDGNPVTQPTGGMVGEVRASSDKGPSGEDGTRSAQVQAQGTDAGGQVVRGDLGVTNYVGGTHFAAILQDIGELKSYFEYPDDDEGETGGDPFEAGASPEFLLLGQSAPRNREELLSLLPEKSVIDRLMMRYFNSNIPSQHILHKLTFTKEYNEYWQDPHSVSLHWLAVLFMVISLGIFISTFEAPQELAADSPMNSKDRFRLYRDAAGTALIWGKYSQPNQCTLQAMLLYAEAEFVTNRQSQMKCYLLCSVLIRLMLKMGLHRDPSKLPNISPYDGEMRRRVWNLAIQIDLLAAFHLGLPAMIHGIESDTSLPHNLLDSDFNEDSKELPLSRPQSEYTPLSYAINKAALCRVFGLVARQAHSLNIPTYAEVLKLDAVLEETYNAVPTFLRVKPMEKSITDHPMQVIQRYGLASLYQKSRCVLHRKYITDAIPKTEHEYSRRACLSASLELLRYQDLLYNACKPGGMLSPNGWFISSMAVNDFLLADMVVALIIQSEEYPEVIGESKQYTRDSSIPTKDALLDILRRSAFIWQEMCVNVPECKKAAELISTVTRKIQVQMGLAPSSIAGNEIITQLSSDPNSVAHLTSDGVGAGSRARNLEEDGVSDQDAVAFFNFPAPSLVHENTADRGMVWMIGGPGTDYDWSQLDTFGDGDPSFTAGDQSDYLSMLDRNPLDDLDFITRNITGTTSLGLR